MKKLLLPISILLCTAIGFAGYSCNHKLHKSVKSNDAIVNQKTEVAEETQQVGSANNGPNQKVLDSIKKAKLIQKKLGTFKPSNSN